MECFRRKRRCAATILLLEYFRTKVRDVNLIICNTKSRQFVKCGLLAPKILATKMTHHFCMGKENILQHPKQVKLTLDNYEKTLTRVFK